MIMFVLSPMNLKTVTRGLFVAFLAVFLQSCETKTKVSMYKYFDTTTDIEGNVYKIVEIHGQTWFAENLRTTKLNDGTPIQNGTHYEIWKNADTAAYCWYNNEQYNYGATYGALYNWHAVNTGKLCPHGWKVPGEEDWMTLIDSLKGVDVAGGRMKHTGAQYWTVANVQATNSSGFTALPGGCRNIISEYKFINDRGFWWSRSRYDDSSAWFHSLYYYSGKIYTEKFHTRSGFSVRCVKEKDN